MLKDEWKLAMETLSSSEVWSGPPGPSSPVTPHAGRGGRPGTERVRCPEPALGRTQRTGGAASDLAVSRSHDPWLLMV